MFLPIEWLRDYLQKPEVKIDASDLASKLTMRGVQVASVKQSVQGLDSVVVGKILAIAKHPNADRLQVTQVIVDPGPEAKQLQIVCGAKNIAEGDIVPVALPGANLPGDLKIKVSAIRGVESHGMLCSSKELGVADDAEGILQLPKNSTLGQPVSNLLGGGGKKSDAVLELELTTNRYDCLSMLGLAREAAPLLKTKLREPKPARFKVTPHRTSSIVKVEVDDAEVCPRYVARVIDGIKVTDSPDWIKQRLESVGMRPINNIVDITNFVMLEYGQPLHAFDLRKLQSGGIRVAPAKEPSSMTLLDGNTVEILPGDILILDGDRPIALAGIMGGANSHIEPDTTSIVLESAAFSPQAIRKTSKRLGLKTESSKRFEKAYDLAAVALASERAAGLLRDSFNANVYHPAIDTNEYGVKEPILALDMRDVRKISGIVDMNSDTVATYLEEIGISSHKKSANILSVRLPSFRPDLREPVDLIEEVVRIGGYDSIPLKLPLSNSAYDRPDETAIEFEIKAKNTLAGLGLRETIHYSFTSEANLDRCGLSKENRVILQNPISEDLKVLRTSLIPSLLQTYKYNYNRKILNQKLFEVARIYFPNKEEETQVREFTCVAGLIAGNSSPESWKKVDSPVDFFYGKGIVDYFCKQLTTVFLSYETPRHTRLFHPHRSAVLKLGLREVGWLGELHPLLRNTYLETAEPVIIFELSLDSLRRYERTSTKFKAPGRFPSIDLDLAFVVEKACSSHSLQETIRQAAGTLLSDVTLFDVYEGEHVAQEKKSLAFHLVFQSTERTLQEEEVTAVRTKIVESVAQKHGAQLRS